MTFSEDEQNLPLRDGNNLTNFWFDDRDIRGGRLHVDGYFGGPKELEPVHGSDYGLADQKRIYAFLGALIAQQEGRA
ncbi:MAG TPA: hypothetical protein VIQ30_05400 [Pseudonocardia sp.]